MLTSTLAAVMGAYYSQPSPMPCQGPACYGPSLAYQDTTLTYRAGTYYRYSKGNTTGLGLNVATSSTLTGNWTYAGTILGSALKSSCGSFDGQRTSWRWAPEIHLISGVYYLYYTVEYPGGSGGGTCFDQMVATSSDLATWVDVGSMGLPVSPREKSNNGSGVTRDVYTRIDGNLLASVDDPQGYVGPPYMVFGSYQFGLYGVHLANLTHVVPNETPQLVIAAQKQPPPTGAHDTSGNYTEGAYQLIRGNYIYIFYSRGACCTASNEPIANVYQTQVCRTALSNGPTGEYLDRRGQSCRTGGDGGWERTGAESLFLYGNNENGTKASVWVPGSVGVLKDPKEGVIMYYQYQNNIDPDRHGQIGFGWNYLSWSSDNWPILTANKPTTT